MKQAVAFFLICLLLLPMLLLPVSAAAVPSDPLIALTQKSLDAHLGKDTPGAAVGIVQEGEVRMLEGFGYADITSRLLVTPETVFEIGPLSGIFTVLAAYRLAEQGRLDLKCDIAAYLPADFMGELELTHPVTTEQLLLGCGGFEGRTFDLIFKKASHRFDSLPKALLAEVPRQVVAPGELYAYSPFGIALAAYVVECVAGESYDGFVTAQVLTPLGMTRTALNPDEHTSTEGMASGHTSPTEGTFSAVKAGGRSYAGLYPASGARSCGADLVRLVAFLLRGEPTVLQESTRQLTLETVCKNGIFYRLCPRAFGSGRSPGYNG